MSTATPAKRPAPNRPRTAASPRQRPTKITPNIDPIRILRRHMITLSFVLIIGCGIGVGLWKLLDTQFPLFSSESVFQIQQGLSEVSDFGTGDVGLNDDAVIRLGETHSLAILSRPYLVDAVDNPEVRNTDWYKTFADEETGVVNAEDAVDDLVKTLRAGMIPGTFFFRLSWKYSNPDDVPVVLNAISDTYMKVLEAQEESRYNENLQEFRTRNRKISDDITRLSANIKDLIRTAGLTNLTDTQYSQTSKSLDDIAIRLAETENLLSLAESQYQQTSAKISGTLEPSEDDYASAEQDRLIQPVSMLIIDLKTSLRVAREKFPNPTHPQIVQLEQQLTATEAEKATKIDEIVQRNLESRLKLLANEIDAAQSNRDRLEAEFESLDEQLRQLAADQTEYEQMEAERTRLEEQRMSNLTLIRDVELMRTRSAEASLVTWAQPAGTPREKSFPKPYIIIPLTGIALVGATLGLIFLRELTDQRVKSAADLDIVPNARVLGVLPDLDDEPRKVAAAESVVSTHPRSVLAESYRQASSPIIRGMELSGHQTLLVAGGMPGSGTTSAITNLASLLASSGRKVLVIDANFRRPRLAKAFGVSGGSDQGLGDILAGDGSLGGCTQNSESGVDIISAGTPANRVFERLGTEAFDSLLAEARAEYDYVIIDAAPAIVAGDASVIANKVDAAILIVRANQEQRGLVVRLINQFGQANCELLGLLLNRPRGTVGGYFKKNFATMAKYADAGQK